MGEKEKGLKELEIFNHFASLSGLRIVPDTVKKREPPKPDVFCEVEGFGGAREKVGFELTELRSEDLSEIDGRQEKYIRKFKEWEEGGRVGKAPQLEMREKHTKAFWVDEQNDVVKRLLTEKFKNPYEGEYPKELIVYYTGNSILPVDVMLPTIGEHLVECRTFGVFRKVWFFCRKNSLEERSPFYVDVSSIARDKIRKLDQIPPGKKPCSFCMTPLDPLLPGAPAYFCSSLCLDRKDSGEDWMPH